MSELTSEKKVILHVVSHSFRNLRGFLSGVDLAFGSMLEEGVEPSSFIAYRICDAMESTSTFLENGDAPTFYRILADLELIINPNNKISYSKYLLKLQKQFSFTLPSKSDLLKHNSYGVYA